LSVVGGDAGVAVEDAIRAAAPEVSSIELVAAEPAAPAVIPAESLLARIKTAVIPKADPALRQPGIRCPT